MLREELSNQGGQERLFILEEVTVANHRLYVAIRGQVALIDEVVDLGQRLHDTSVRGVLAGFLLLQTGD